MTDHGPYSGVVDIARNGIDEVIRLKAQAKQDDLLIGRLVEALEKSQLFVEASANKKLRPGWGAQLDRAEDAINAARAQGKEVKSNG